MSDLLLEFLTDCGFERSLQEFFEVLVGRSLEERLILSKFLGATSGWGLDIDILKLRLDFKDWQRELISIEEPKLKRALNAGELIIGGKALDIFHGGPGLNTDVDYVRLNAIDMSATLGLTRHLNEIIGEDHKKITSEFGNDYSDIIPGEILKGPEGDFIMLTQENFKPFISNFDLTCCQVFIVKHSKIPEMEDYFLYYKDSTSMFEVKRNPKSVLTAQQEEIHKQRLVKYTERMQKYKERP